jgi:hypothetical protein
MAERRMLLNSAESFIGTMRIERDYENVIGFQLNLNNNIEIIKDYFNSDIGNHVYIIGFKKEFIIPENFISYDNQNDYLTLSFYSDYNIKFTTNSIICNECLFYGNFIFKYN